LMDNTKAMDFKKKSCKRDHKNIAITK